MLFLTLTLLLLQPDWSLYHKSDDLLNEINSIVERNGKWMEIEKDTAGSGDPIPRITLRHPHIHHPLSSISSPIALSPRDPPLRTLINCGEHGRELISSEIAITLMQYWDITQWNMELTSRDVSLTSLHPSIAIASPLYLDYIFQYMSTMIFPLVNVWSRKQVENGHLCTRKNIQGVDLNRNWGYRWNEQDSTSVSQVFGEENAFAPKGEQYPGQKAFSELESRSVRSHGCEWHPTLYINIHSGIREMYYGWDYTSELIPNHQQVHQLLSQVNSRHCGCPIGGAGKIGGYVVYGSSMDYMYAVCNVSHSITVEVYGGQGSTDECFAYFNPRTAEDYHRTRLNWAHAVLSAQEYMIHTQFHVFYPYSPYKLSDQQILQAPTHEFYSTFTHLSRRFPPHHTYHIPLVSRPSNTHYTQHRHSETGDDTTSKSGEAEAEAVTEQYAGGESHDTTNNNNDDGDDVDVDIDPDQDTHAHTDSAEDDSLLNRLRSLNPFSNHQHKRTHVLSLIEIPATQNTTSTSTLTSTSTSTSTQTSIVTVLIVGGMHWNDLLSTELVAALLHQGSPLPHLRLFFIPSLHGYYRQHFTEAAQGEPLCFHSLSVSSQRTLHRYQSLFSRTLSHLCDQLHPHVILYIQGSASIRNIHLHSTSIHHNITAVQHALTTRLPDVKQRVMAIDHDTKSASETYDGTIPIRQITFPSSVKLVMETHLRHHLYDQSNACDLPTYNVEPVLLSREIHHHLPRLMDVLHAIGELPVHETVAESRSHTLPADVVTVNDENYMSGYLSAMHHAHLSPETWSLALPILCLIVLPILLICLYRRRHAHAKRREE